jgi:hypothetical protein
MSFVLIFGLPHFQLILYKWYLSQPVPLLANRILALEGAEAVSFLYSSPQNGCGISA